MRGSRGYVAPMNGRQRQAIYLALAVVGLVGCWYFNLQWMGGTGPHTVRAFIEAAFANSASASISWDLTFGALAATVFTVVEANRLQMQRPWMYVILVFVVAFAAAFPLFLAMRERALSRVATA
jgi:hypothetical protein